MWFSHLERSLFFSSQVVGSLDIFGCEIVGGLCGLGRWLVRLCSSAWAAAALAVRGCGLSGVPGMVLAP